MKLDVKIAELDYGSVIELALPLLGKKLSAKEGLIGKIAPVLTQIPTELILPVFAAIEDEKKNEIVALVVNEKKEKIIGAAEKLLSGKGIGVEVKDISLSDELELEVKLENIDYDGIIKTFLEKGDTAGETEDEAGKLIKKLKSAPKSAVSALLSLISQSGKDKLVAYIINKSKAKLISVAESKAESAGIKVKIADISVEI